MVIEMRPFYDHALFEPHTSFVIRSPVVMKRYGINTQHLKPQATWIRRRVIGFGLARCFSRYFAKSNHFPREKNARRREHVQKADHLLKGNQHLFSPNKVVIAFRKVVCLLEFCYIRKGGSHKQGSEPGSNLIWKNFKRWCQKVWS